MSAPGPEDPIRANNALWDEWTAIHERSEFYDLEGFKAGGVRLRPYEIGSVVGKDLLHLQCHFGIDTLSWARLGARVTGADFSQAACDLASSVAAEIAPGGAVRSIRPLRPPGESRGRLRRRLYLAGCPGLVAGYSPLGGSRGSFRPPRRHLLHRRNPPRRSGLRGRGRRAGRAATRLPVLGAP